VAAVASPIGILSIQVAGRMVDGCVPLREANSYRLSQPPRWSQPCPNLLRGLGTRKSVQKQRCPQPHPVVPTFCYTFMWENGKGREHVFLYEKRRTPVGDTEVGTTSGQAIGVKRERAVPTPSKVGATRSEVGTGMGSASIVAGRVLPGSFRFSRGPPNATSCGDRSRRPTTCEPSR